MLSKQGLGIGMLLAAMAFVGVAEERLRIVYPSSDTVLFGRQPVCVEGAKDDARIVVRVLEPGDVVRDQARADASGCAEFDFGRSLESFRLQASAAWSDANGRYHRATSEIVRTLSAKPPSAEAALYHAVVSLTPAQIAQAERRMAAICRQRVGSSAATTPPACAGTGIDDTRWYSGSFAGQPVTIRDVELSGGDHHGLRTRLSVVLLDISSSMVQSLSTRAIIIEHLKQLQAEQERSPPGFRRRFAVYAFAERVVPRPEGITWSLDEAIEYLSRVTFPRDSPGTRVCKIWKLAMEQAARQRRVLRDAGIEAEVDVIVISDFVDVLPFRAEPDWPECQELVDSAGDWGVAAYAIPPKLRNVANVSYREVVERSGGGIYRSGSYGEMLRRIEERRQLSLEFEPAADAAVGDLIVQSLLLGGGEPFLARELRLKPPMRPEDLAGRARAVVEIHRERIAEHLLYAAKQYEDVGETLSHPHQQAFCMQRARLLRRAAESTAPSQQLVFDSYGSNHLPKVFSLERSTLSFGWRRLETALYEVVIEALIHDPLDAQRQGESPGDVEERTTSFARVLRDVIAPYLAGHELLERIQPLLTLAQLEAFPLSPRTKELLGQVYDPPAPPCASGEVEREADPVVHLDHRRGG